MTKNKIHYYNSELKVLARELRKNSTLAEILLWNNIKNKALGFEFHRQIPIDEFIVDFYCHELLLVIEIDGNTHYYNYVKDMFRQTKLEALGIKVIRFVDLDIKKFINDVMRVLELVVSERKRELGIYIEHILPTPLQWGTLGFDLPSSVFRLRASVICLPAFL